MEALRKKMRCRGMEDCNVMPVSYIRAMLPLLQQAEEEQAERVIENRVKLRKTMDRLYEAAKRRGAIEAQTKLATMIMDWAERINRMTTNCDGSPIDIVREMRKAVE